MSLDDFVFWISRIVPGVLLSWWVSMEPTLQVLIGLMAIDIATGVLASFIRKELNSDASFRGLAKKGVILLLILMAQLLESAVPGIPVAAAVTISFIAHEALSITENAGQAGLPIPAPIRKALVRLNGNDDQSGEA